MAWKCLSWPWLIRWWRVVVGIECLVKSKGTPNLVWLNWVTKTDMLCYTTDLPEGGDTVCVVAVVTALTQSCVLRHGNDLRLHTYSHTSTALLHTAWVTLQESREGYGCKCALPCHGVRPGAPAPPRAPHRHPPQHPLTILDLLWLSLSICSRFQPAANEDSILEIYFRFLFS